MTQTEQIMVRLELLKMAKELLCEEYFAKRDILVQEYASKLENDIWAAKRPEFPEYPTEAQVIDKANALVNFVFGM